MKLKIDVDMRYEEPQIHSPPEELSACHVQGRAGNSIREPQINADERRYIELASAFICVHPRLIRIIHHSMGVGT